MVAKEYLELLKPTCVFQNWDREKGSTESFVCGKPAVAVYVSDDDQPKGRYVCQAHAEEAELDADGPVFWQSIASSLRQFAGFLSVDVPELHHVEVPRLEESVQRFLAALTPSRESVVREPVQLSFDFERDVNGVEDPQPDRA